MEQAIALADLKQELSQLGLTPTVGSVPEMNQFFDPKV
jgi:hypothetical protein